MKGYTSTDVKSIKETAYKKGYEDGYNANETRHFLELQEISTKISEANKCMALAMRKCCIRMGVPYTSNTGDYTKRSQKYTEG